MVGDEKWPLWSGGRYQMFHCILKEGFATFLKIISTIFRSFVLP